jgi:hypothetical protein
MVVNTYNPSTGEAETEEGQLWVQSQTGLYNETPSQQKH